MTQTTNTQAAPARTPDTGRQSPGEYLRKLREEKGHTHAAVGTALHLTVHYIKALESDEYGKLPGLTFVKGYLRAYARFLGADVDSVIARFDEHIAGLLDAGMHTARVERSKRRQDQALRWAVGAGFVVVAGLAAGWWFVSRPDSAPEVAQREAPAPQVASAGTPPTATVTSTAPRSAATFANTVTPTPTPVYPAASTESLAAPAIATQSAASQGIGNENIVAQNVGNQNITPPGVVPTPSAQSLTGTGGATGNVVTDSTGATTVAAAGQGTATTPQPAVSGAPLVTPLASGSRAVSLVAAGNDELRVTFNGNSWIEVDDASMVRLYNDMLRAGDTLTIRGVAPFHVLLGDASHVEVAVNSAAVDISGDIRDDSTARLVLAAPASSVAVPPMEAPAADTAPATTTTPAANAPTATEQAAPAPGAQQ